jgi:hypothetical protein
MCRPLLHYECSYKQCIGCDNQGSSVKCVVRNFLDPAVKIVPPLQLIFAMKSLEEFSVPMLGGGGTLVKIVKILLTTSVRDSGSCPVTLRSDWWKTRKGGKEGPHVLVAMHNGVMRLVLLYFVNVIQFVIWIECKCFIPTCVHAYWYVWMYM